MAAASPPPRIATSAAELHAAARQPEELHAPGDCCAAAAPPPLRLAASAAPLHTAACQPEDELHTRGDYCATPRCLGSDVHCRNAPARGAAHTRRPLHGGGTAAIAPRCLSSEDSRPGASLKSCTRPATAARRQHHRHRASLPQQRYSTSLRASSKMSCTRAATTARRRRRHYRASLPQHSAHHGAQA